MLRRAWKPVAAAVAVGVPGYYAYRAYTAHPSFEIPIRTKGSDGKTEMVTRTVDILPLKTLEDRINQHASTKSHTTPGGTKWNYSTAFLASNDPIEDANATQVVQRDDTDPSAPGDYLFFAIMDGHSGTHTSQLLSKILIKAVALELFSLASNPSAQTKSTSGILSSAKRLITGSKPPIITPQGPLDADPKHVSNAIAEAFARLDHELINAPLRILANNLDEESKKNKVIPDLSQHPLALTSMLPAVSGSCAIMAVLDTAHEDLYVACTGDSRAVAGIWEPTEDGKGQWRIEVLSEDQTGRNPNEAERMRAEHPGEADHVIRDGRVLGGLEPTRAFGDARYKWPRPVQETLSQAFMVGNGKPLRPPPSLFKSPPYVTARPVVTHRKLTFDSSPSPPSQNSTTNTNPLRFLVLATDGLWDQLSNDEVVSLVAGHLSGLQGTIPKSTLPSLIPTTTGSSPGIDGKSASVVDRKKQAAQEGSWAFKDNNLSAHLIRNAFGGGNEIALRKILSIPAPYSRRYRDDVTVTVVWWREGAEAEAEVENVKAKL
ncbi:protein serine/threonine phosphatase 2C [Macrolepiota fuliginosa MF-IS2]|uniref:Protein serine/threonine phosphatase 2C n=1 Tax=Macrolepiota fuliginosa MF-IS2 TaxID=1400762 RepID=A0A9P5X1K9_9AGAR|nr:protein serine/threonine phosphatase 2C [Macrolepiota fuliginosa MF-IS2]